MPMPDLRNLKYPEDYQIWHPDIVLMTPSPSIEPIPESIIETAIVSRTASFKTHSNGRNPSSPVPTTPQLKVITRKELNIKEESQNELDEEWMHQAGPYFPPTISPIPIQTTPHTPTSLSSSSSVSRRPIEDRSTTAAIASQAPPAKGQISHLRNSSGFTLGPDLDLLNVIRSPSRNDPSLRQQISGMPPDRVSIVSTNSQPARNSIIPVITGMNTNQGRSLLDSHGEDPANVLTPEGSNEYLGEQPGETTVLDRMRVSWADTWKGTFNEGNVSIFWNASHGFFRILTSWDYGGILRSTYHDVDRRGIELIPEYGYDKKESRILWLRKTNLKSQRAEETPTALASTDLGRHGFLYRFASAVDMLKFQTVFTGETVYQDL
jgi:hypothetical protein